MSAVARALRCPVWLVWLGLIVTAQTASHRISPVPRPDQASGAATLAPGDRLHVGSPDTPDGDEVCQTSFAFVAHAQPVIRDAEPSAGVFDTPSPRAGVAFSTTHGPRPPPSPVR